MPGFIRTSKHWLTLQTKTGYLILRLDDSNFSKVIDTVEARSGVKVDRVSDKDKN